MRISRRFTLAITFAVLIATASVAAASAVPVLGSKSAWPSGKGWGAVKPKEVFLGGDPTGLFTKLKWSDWGNNKATGKGKGFYDPPNKPVAASVKVNVTLVASSLGHCAGKLAYKKLKVSFVYKGHLMFEPAIKTCS